MNRLRPGSISRFIAAKFCTPSALPSTCSMNFRCAWYVPISAADHAVGVAEAHQHRADQRVELAHRGLRDFRRHAFARTELVVCLPVLADSADRLPDRRSRSPRRDLQLRDPSSSDASRSPPDGRPGSACAIFSSSTNCAARSTRSSSPSANTMRAGCRLRRREHRPHHHAGAVDGACRVLRDTRPCP